jgi:replicative DNA helicase
MWMDVRSENISSVKREDLKMFNIKYAERLEGLLTVNDDTHTRMSDIVRTQLRERYDVLMIDHGGLLNDKQLGGERHDQFIGRQTKAMHDLAKNTQAVVMCLWQLNRGVESRVDKRPHMGDLRDSGHIEQNADNVALMYGEWYYDRTAENITEVNWGKYRDGVKDSLCLVRFNLATQMFESVATQDFDAYVEQAMEAAVDGVEQPELWKPEDLPF